MSSAAPTSLVWDIDGTLLSNSTLPMRDYIADAINAVWGAGINANSLELHGRTDLQIVADALRLPPADVRSRMPVLEAMISDRSGLDLPSLASERRVLPGVNACLNLPATLVAHQTVASGAGSLRSIRKLAGHRLDTKFCWQCASFGDLAADRVALIKEVLDRSAVHGLMQHVIIGDTPEDIVAAQTLDVPVVAVASGSYSLRALAAWGPDLLLKEADAAELERFVVALGR